VVLAVVARWRWLYSIVGKAYDHLNCVVQRCRPLSSLFQCVGHCSARQQHWNYLEMSLERSPGVEESPAISGSWSQSCLQQPFCMLHIQMRGNFAPVKCTAHQCSGVTPSSSAIFGSAEFTNSSCTQSACPKKQAYAMADSPRPSRASRADPAG